MNTRESRDAWAKRGRRSSSSSMIEAGHATVRLPALDLVFERNDPDADVVDHPADRDLAVDEVDIVSAQSEQLGTAQPT